MAIAGTLKQSTSVTIKVGPFVDETDGKTAETSLTISQADVRLSKNSGNMAQKNEATSLTHDEIGMYDCPLDATDTNTVGILTVSIHESGALPVRHDYQVVEEAIYDAFFATSANMATQVTTIASDLVQVYSDTTAIHTQTTGIYSDTTIIASDLVQVYSDTTAIHTQTTGIYSDTTAIHSDTTAIHLQTTAIYSDTTAIGTTVAHTGTAQSGGSMTITLAMDASSTNNIYRSMTIYIESGTGAGQARTITGYTGGSRLVAVDVDWQTTPDNTSVYKILQTHVPALDSGQPTWALAYVVGTDDEVIDSNTFAANAIDANALATSAVTEINAATSASLTIIASDLLQVYSDTTHIHSDTTAIHTQTTGIYSDTTHIHSDTTAIHTQTTGIYSDTTIIASDLVQVYSDTTVIASDVAALESDLGSTAEVGQGNPPSTTTAGTRLRYLYKAWRNRTTQTSSEYALYADDGSTKDQEAVVSDDGTTFERGEVSTGA